MKYGGEVNEIHGRADDARITLTNVRRLDAAPWREYASGITFDVPLGRAKSFPLGRSVTIEIKPT